MKKLLLAMTAAVALAGGSATAADLAYKAAPPPIEVFDWSGIYIGAHVGFGWGRTDVTDHTLLGNILLIPTQRFDTQGGLGGVQGGWNYQFGRFVLSTELDFSWANVKADQTSPFLLGIGTINRSSKATWIGTATTRLGYAWDRVLFYTKIGAAWAHFDYNDNASIVIVGPVYTSPASENRSGWTVGTGIEWAFLGGWSAKVEYDYIDFGRRTVDFNPVAGVIPVNLDIDHRISEIKFGLNYRFGGMGPFAARY